MKIRTILFYFPISCALSCISLSGCKKDKAPDMGYDSSADTSASHASVSGYVEEDSLIALDEDTASRVLIYEKGYKTGYDDGFRDGELHYDEHQSYDDYNAFGPKMAAEYRRGYQKGYSEGYTAGKADFERNSVKRDTSIVTPIVTEETILVPTTSSSATTATTVARVPSAGKSSADGSTQSASAAKGRTNYKETGACVDGTVSYAGKSGYFIVEVSGSYSVIEVYSGTLSIGERIRGELKRTGLKYVMKRSGGEAHVIVDAGNLSRQAAENWLTERGLN